MGPWEALIRYYDNVPEVCPIAHTYITPRIAVLLSQEGKFLCAAPVEIKELVAVPCTWESEARSSNNAPHLLSDNLTYVINVPTYEVRHEKYMEQLGQYVEAVPDDVYAGAVYRYQLGGTLANDISELIAAQPKTYKPAGIYVVFGAYGIECDGTDRLWEKRYINSLPKNGVCSITGKRDFIPPAYPRGIIQQGGKERLFMRGGNVGYIASEKIIHSLRWLAYAKTADAVTTREYFREELREAGYSEENILEIEREIVSREIEY